MHVVICEVESLRIVIDDVTTAAAAGMAVESEMFQRAVIAIGSVSHSKSSLVPLWP